MRFILVDRLDHIDAGRSAAASATFPPDLEIFADHFPWQPIVPGTLLTEAMAQTAGWLIAASIDFARWPLLVLVDRARFHRLVSPGEPLAIEADVRSARGDAWEVMTRVRSGGSTVAEARLLFHLFTFDADSARVDAWGRTTFSALGGDGALVAAPPARGLS